MPSRYRSRQTALQILYLCDQRQLPADQAIASYYDSLSSEEAEPVNERDPFAEDLASGVLSDQGAIDALIAQFAENWRMERMAVVDRNILRLAVHEMRNLATPAAVVIDQALDLAEKFSGDNATGFINGVLDAVNNHLNASKYA